MLLLEKKLSVQIAHINRVEIDLRRKRSLYHPLRDGRTKGLVILTTVMLLNPVRTKFLSSSHPIPPAPTTNTEELATVERSDLSKKAISYYHNLGGAK